jgi:hypothetical protein
MSSKGGTKWGKTSIESYLEIEYPFENYKLLFHIINRIFLQKLSLCAHLCIEFQLELDINMPFISSQDNWLKKMIVKKI